MRTSKGQSVAWLTERPLVLYGAGNAGRHAARNILRAGGQIAAFLDMSAQSGEQRDDIPVYTLVDWAARNEPYNFNVLLSIFNPQADVFLILAELQRLRFRHIVTIVDYVNTFPDNADTPRMWLAPSVFYDNKQELIRATRALLCIDLVLYCVA